MAPRGTNTGTGARNAPKPSAYTNYPQASKGVYPYENTQSPADMLALLRQQTREDLAAQESQLYRLGDYGAQKQAEADARRRQFQADALASQERVTGRQASAQENVAQTQGHSSLQIAQAQARSQENVAGTQAEANRFAAAQQADASRYAASESARASTYGADVGARSAAEVAGIQADTTRYGADKQFDLGLRQIGSTEAQGAQQRSHEKFLAEMQQRYMIENQFRNSAYQAVMDGGRYW